MAQRRPRFGEEHSPHSVLSSTSQCWGPLPAEGRQLDVPVPLNRVLRRPAS